MYVSSSLIFTFCLTDLLLKALSVFTLKADLLKHGKHVFLRYRRSSGFVFGMGFCIVEAVVMGPMT